MPNNTESSCSTMMMMSTSCSHNYSRRSSSSRSSSRSSSLSTQTTSYSSFDSRITTPGWRIIDYECDNYVKPPAPTLENISDDAYIQRHRLIELRERYNLLVYELKREARKKRSSRGYVVENQVYTDEEELDLEKVSAGEIEDAISRIEKRSALRFAALSSQNSSNRRRKRFVSSSSSTSTASITSFSMSSYSAATTVSDASTSATSSSCVSPTQLRKFTPVVKLMTSLQARQIKSISFAKLAACSLTRQDIESLAEKTTKRIKLDESETTPSLKPPSLSLPASTSLFTSKESQLKQIENIEKSAIEISLSQGKILRTTKQAMDKPPLDLLRTSYCTFYRRIN